MCWLFLCCWLRECPQGQLKEAVVIVSDQISSRGLDPPASVPASPISCPLVLSWIQRDVSVSLVISTQGFVLQRPLWRLLYGKSCGLLVHRDKTVRSSLGSSVPSIINIPALSHLISPSLTAHCPILEFWILLLYFAFSQYACIVSNPAKLPRLKSFSYL